MRRDLGHVAHGMPSVTQTTSLMPASAASNIASRAKRAGTKKTATSAPVSATASRTVSKTGTPSTVWPPLPGETPATTFVPAASMYAVWNAPSRPVMPWTQTRLFRSMRMAIRPHLRGRGPMKPRR